MFKTAATKIAHNSTIPALAGNQDLRPLQDLITAEKAVIVSLQKLSVDFSKASEALRNWGLGEGDDLGNILSASTTILTHFSSALSQYAAHGHTMREQLKAIRTREENLDDLRRRRRGVMSKAESAEKKLSKMSPEHKNLPQQSELLNRLQEEIRGLDVEIMREEAATGDFKRSTTRSCMGLKFGGLLECCEKGVIAGEFGKLVVFEIPEDETQPGLPRSPYWGHAKVESHVAEAHRCVNEVRLSTVPSINQSSRRAEQQLPQIPAVSDSPFVHQGSPSSATQPPTDAYNDGAMRDYPPASQGQGSTFLDSPLATPASTFNQQPQYYGSLSSASAIQSGTNRRVDEFGSTDGPIDTPTTGGGRFATFPVKGRSGSVGTSGGHQFHDNPSLLAADHGPTGSFSSSVTQALAAERSPREEKTSALGKPGRFSRDGPAPAYEPNPDNPWAGQQRLTPNDHTLLSAHTRQASNLSEDDALLAYMTASQEPVTDQGESAGLKQDKHHSPDDLSMHGRRPPEDRNHRIEEPAHPQDASPSHTSHAPGPDNDHTAPLNREDEERALNAAAAREVALELQSGATSRTPSLSPTSPVPSAVAPQQETSTDIYQREPPASPLIPPSASYMADRRSVSPRPEYTPTYAESPHTGSPSSPLTQQHNIVSSPMAQPNPPNPPMPQPHIYGPGHLPPRLTVDRPQPYDSQPDSYQRYAAIHPQDQHYEEQAGQNQYTPSSPAAVHRVPPPQINFPPEHSGPRGRSPFYQEPAQGDGANDSTMSSAYQTPAQTPSEHAPPSPGGSLGAGAGAGRGNSPYLRSPAGGAPANRSSSSINTTGSSGGGKISAAAFKRPPPRLGSGGGPPSPFSAMSGTMPSGGASGAETKKSHSPYPSTGSREEQYGQIQSRKRETQELDAGQYSYISAYVNSVGADGEGTDQGQGGVGGWTGAGPGGQQQPPSAGGYGEGRFATNLERDSLM